MSQAAIREANAPSSHHRNRQNSSHRNSEYAENKVSRLHTARAVEQFLCEQYRLVTQYRRERHELLREIRYLNTELQLHNNKQVQDRVNALIERWKNSTRLITVARQLLLYVLETRKLPEPETDL